VKTKFLLHYLKAPSMVGSIIPSSAVLARSLSRHAHGADHIIELGAGTGVITHQLERTFPLVPLVVVERDSRMAGALRARFPRPTIVAANVEDCAHLFDHIPDASVVISSLPFRSLPVPVADDIIRLLSAFLLVSPQRQLAQFSYGHREPFSVPNANLRWTKHELVLRNFPPAWVWTLRQHLRAEENTMTTARNNVVATIGGSR
jgi:phosphatidylethanolamine/phosphatidyl-N-methylethanolamine N-methyltransferase